MSPFRSELAGQSSLGRRFAGTVRRQPTRTTTQALIGGGLLSLLAFAIAWQHEGLTIRSEFAVTAGERFDAIGAQVTEQRWILASIRALWAGSEEVTRDEFARFTRPLLELAPGFRAVEWAPRSPGGDGTVQVPVRYVEPEGGNEPALGFDLMSETRRREALLRAGASGRIQTTAPIDLVQDSRGATHAVLSVLPIYSTTAVLDTTEARREALLGFAVGVVEPSGILAAALGLVEPDGEAIEILDPAYPGLALAEWSIDGVTVARPARPEASGVVERRIDVGGREWLLRCAPEAGHVGARRGWTPWALLGVGLLLTGLVAGWQRAREKRAEEASRSELEYRAIFESATDGLVLMSHEGALVEANPAACEMHGYSRADFLALTPEHFIHADDLHLFRTFVEEVSAGRTFDCTPRILRPDGSVFWLEVHGTPMQYCGEPHLLAILRDVTGRRRAEREREELQRQLLHAQKLESLGVLAGGIAHDFNNILTVIGGHAALARDELTPDSLAQDSLVQVVAATERASKLTGQLLSYAGGRPMTTRSLDLSVQVRACLHLLKAAIPKKVRLVLELSEGLPAVEADAAQMQQLVMNLLMNGAEACGEESGQVVVRTRLEELDEQEVALLGGHGVRLSPGPHVVLELSDDGCGMDEHTMSRMFDPFFSTKFTGRGLGLAALLGIVRGHHGNLEIDSTPGIGTTVRVLLPASSKDVENDDEPELRADAGGRGVILVVDDEKTVREVALRCLSRSGYQVLEAEDGRGALAIICEQGDRIDLVVLDMTMPIMGGDEALRAMRDMRPEVPVVLISGYAEEEATRRVRDAPPDAFLQKPFSPARLVATVGEALERARGASPGDTEVQEE